MPIEVNNSWPFKYPANRVTMRRFRDTEMLEISELIDTAFREAVKSVEIFPPDFIRGPIAAEIRSNPPMIEHQCDDEYRYLVINDYMFACAFIRRTDLNHYELMLTTIDHH